MREIDQGKKHKDRSAVQRLRRVTPVRQVKHVFRAFREFARLEAAGGILLMAMAVIALLWANSPWSALYFDLWHAPLSFEIGPYMISHDLHWWINEGLMVIFFFVVGLEIKREILVGELASKRQAALPVAAALGGMLLPAALYLVINAGTGGTRGWAVPMATDIAFALGVLALVGSRVPLSLKVFLTALAIVDDIGAVLVIALFYTAEIVWLNLVLAGLFLGLLIIANVFGARSPILYAMLGIGLWLAFLGSGLHATLAGILMALTIPARGKIHSREFLAQARKFLHDFEYTGETSKGLLTSDQQEALQALEDNAQEIQTPLQRLEHALHPWVTFGVIPLFALSNAGVIIRGEILSIFLQPVSLGIVIGLIIGKQVGVSLASWLAVKLNLAELPEDISWWDIYGASWLAGIGFTMSLFISALAFVDEQSLEAAKVGILGASLVAGVVGFTLLRFSSGRQGEA